MATITRAEREQRNEQDDGDPGDTVWVARGKYATIYHDDPDCHLLGDGETRDRTRKEAQEAGRGACKYCVLGNRSGGGGVGRKTPLERAMENGDVPDELLPRTDSDSDSESDE